MTADLDASLAGIGAWSAPDTAMSSSNVVGVHPTLGQGLDLTGLFRLPEPRSEPAQTRPPYALPWDIHAAPTASNCFLSPALYITLGPMERFRRQPQRYERLALFGTSAFPLPSGIPALGYQWEEGGGDNTATAEEKRVMTLSLSSDEADGGSMAKKEKLETAEEARALLRDG